MVPEIDVWRVAERLLELHGPDASIHAALRANELHSLGDFEGQVTWVRILRAVAALLSADSRGAVH